LSRYGNDFTRGSQEYQSLVKSKLVGCIGVTPLHSGQFLVFTEKREESMDELIEVLDVSRNNSDRNLCDRLLVTHVLEVLQSVCHGAFISVIIG